MAASRPGSGAVMTIAVLHFVGGGVGLIMSLCMGVGLFVIAGGGGAPPPGGGPDLQGHLMKNVAGYFPAKAAFTAIGLIFDILLIVAGVGLLMRQQWGRYASIGYGVLSLLGKLAELIYQVAVINPIAKPFLEANAPPNMPPAERSGFIFGALYGNACFTVVLMIYPLVVLAVMFLPSVVKYFESRPRARDEDYDDRRDRRPRRDEDDFDDRRIRRRDEDDYDDRRDRFDRDRDRDRDRDEDRGRGRSRRDDDDDYR